MNSFGLLCIALNLFVIGTSANQLWDEKTPPEKRKSAKGYIIFNSALLVLNLVVMFAPLK